MTPEEIQALTEALRSNDNNTYEYIRFAIELGAVVFVGGGILQQIRRMALDIHEIRKTLFGVDGLGGLVHKVGHLETLLTTERKKN